MRTARFQDAGPILDARAKAEYARRLDELRAELEDAERLNDPERAERIWQERDCIADQLAAAVGLGGRNRRAASDAERARSAVTERIKESIGRIEKAIPPSAAIWRPESGPDISVPTTRIQIAPSAGKFDPSAFLVVVTQKVTV